MVAAAERAAELGRSEEDMGAAYYYRFEIRDTHDEPSRDVSSIVPARAGKPIGCTLADFALCPVVPHDSFVP